MIPRTTWREGFWLYDRRHTGHTLSTRSGATPKDTRGRAGQSSERAAMIYQRFDEERRQEVAAKFDALIYQAASFARSQAA